MRTNSRTRTHFIALASTLAWLAPAASAQGLMATQGVIVATDGDVVPDTAGLPIAGFSFGGSGALGDNCVLDESGKLLFRGRFVDSGGSTNAFNDKAYFYGSTRANLKMVIRGGDQAPGLPAGFQLRTEGGNLTAISGAVRLSPAGHTWFGSYFFDSTGGTTSSNNNEGLFGGPVGSPTLLLRKGDPAPGTVGATFVQAFSSPNLLTAGINRSGHCYFLGSLTGGDVVGTGNQQGIWSGLPGSLDMVARKGSPAPTPAFPGAYVADTVLAIGTQLQMNDSGQLFYDLLLSQTLGSPMATAANDKAYLVHTPGSGSAVLVREGDLAPGTSGGTFNAVTGDAWTAGLSANDFTRNGETLFSTELRGGDVILGVTERALYAGGAGTLALACRQGDAAPGTDAAFDNWNTNSLNINASGHICFQGLLTGGSSSTANDTGIWTGVPGALQLILREGSVVPFTGGSSAGQLYGQSLSFNDRGQILFTVSLSGGSVTGNALFAWDPTQGLMPVLLLGDHVQISAGVQKTVSSFGGVGNNNTSGAALGFGHDGRVAERVGFSDGTYAIMTVRFGVSTPTTAYCFGDGSGTACPCGNLGAAGNGCGNSIQAGGANLAGSGLASISSDTYLLSGSGMPNSSVLYYQGTTRVGGGIGSVFGDGLRCAAGTVIRLSTKANTGGASHYPAVGDLSISVRGLIVSAGTRDYQAWYRNAAAFCTVQTFNLSNAVEVVWIP
jgi:hypothetical protein